MTSIFDSSRQVKSSARKPFAAGLIATQPVRSNGERRMPFTAADLAWAAHELNKDTSDYEVVPAAISGGSPEADEQDWDAMARDSYAMDCLESGLIPSDVAACISRTTLVGHPA